MQTCIHMLKQVISLSLAVYQFLVYDIGKKSYKIHTALKKLLIVSYPSCALFLLSYAIDKFILFSKSEKPKFCTTKIQLPSRFRS